MAQKLRCGRAAPILDSRIGPSELSDIRMPLLPSASSAAHRKAPS
jgi:hypothetical protein